MRISERRTIHGRRPCPARDGDSAPVDRRASLIALALILLLGLAAFPLLSNGRVLDNLGAGLRHWAGVNR